jgi:hypothetical protein
MRPTQEKKGMRVYTRRLGAVFMAFGVGLPLLGCASRPERESRDLAMLLPYLEDNKTTKEAVLMKLGEPSGHFEGERILTYRMADDEKGGVTISSTLLTT